MRALLPPTMALDACASTDDVERAAARPTTCARLPDGPVGCWGAGAFGQVERDGLARSP